VLGAASLNQFGFAVERFAADTITSGVVAFVDVTVCAASTLQTLDTRRVPGVGARLNEVIELNVEWSREISESTRIFVDQHLRRYTESFCGLHVLKTVVVRAAQQPDLIAL